MIKLYFMRHGIAAERARGGDRKRPLTPKGIQRMNKASRGLAALSLTFDRILTSRLERARQTAMIVAKNLQLEDRVEEIEQLAPEQKVENLLAALAAYSGQKNILLVGHEPLLSSTISYLLAGKTGMAIALKKGALCCLEVDTLPPHGRAALHWALAPKQLRRMGR